MEITTIYLDHAKKNAKKDANLWIKALTYFSRKTTCASEIVEVLKAIESNQILPPLQIIKLLSQSQSANLGLVKAHLKKYIMAENKEISDYRKQIKEYYGQNKQIKDEIKDLTSGPKIFKIPNCTRCRKALTLPAVHFLCNHSYHRSCMMGDVDECPVCSDDVKDYKQRQRDMEQTSKKQNEFFRQLEASNNDGFVVISNYFSYGLFNKQSDFYDLAEVPALDPNLLKGIDL